MQFESLESTNQKLYQLSGTNCPSWTVVKTDIQSAGKGYANNRWLSEPYKNATFSFIIRHALIVDQEMPYFNMWVASEIASFLTNWQLSVQVKWPNDIILNGKKLGGILIESKLIGNRTRFTIVGLGINIHQTNFDDLFQATSLKKENEQSNIDISSFIKDLMLHFYKNYYKIENKAFRHIIDDYNNNLFRKNEISVFEWEGKRVNGIIKEVTSDGNILIDLDGVGEKLFRYKEIKLLY